MKKKTELKLMYALSFAAQLGFLVIAPLAGFIWLGAYLDRTFSTGPTFSLTGLVIGLSVTVYETFHLLAPLIEKDEEGEDRKDPAGKT